MNGNDFAKAIGINKPANVRDKIKRWQQAVEPDSEAAETADEKPEPAPPPPPPPPPPPNPGTKLKAKLVQEKPGLTARAKIKKWQQDVENEPENTETTDAPTPDDAESKPAPSTPVHTTPKIKPLDEKPNWAPKHTPNKSVEVSPERPAGAIQPPVHNKLDEDVHTATAPKKRVISDSRWRNKQSPPKDTGRPAPKTIPNAWVRPSKVLKNAPTPSPPKTPTNPIIPLLEYVGKSTGQKVPPVRQRRLSKPSSSENDQRPTSSGSGSGKEPKNEENASPPTPPQQPQSTPPMQPKEKVQAIKVRPRRRAQTSPRVSLSAESSTQNETKGAQKSATSANEQPENAVVVEYEESKITSPRDDELRQRRRRRRPRSQGDVTADESPKPITAAARRRNRPSNAKSDTEEAAVKEAEPTPAEDVSPNKTFGSRLEAWLHGTPDPFVDTKRPIRRKSDESVSTLELPSKTDKSNITEATTQDQEDSPEASRPRSNGSGSRRRRRRRSRELKIDTENADKSPPATEEDLDSSVAAKEPATSLTSTPTLKRRGAKRSQLSPTKGRSLSSPLQEPSSKEDMHQNKAREADEESSTLSSTVETPKKSAEKVPIRSRPLGIQRMFPSTGNRLSTIVSVESFAAKTDVAPASEVTYSDTITTISEETGTVTDATPTRIGSRRNVETSTMVSRRSTRRKRLASHSDLISVLSMPKASSKSIVSARSIRTNRSRLATATIGDIMRELATDESKFMRELRTLVDGVIPVLLSCVLSKSDSAIAAGLFSRSANIDPTQVTKPIVDMGVCLEKLKTLHMRVPTDDPDDFISWAQSAQKVYGDYIASWRLGFQDVVISLAPADDDPFKPAKVVDGPDDGAPWDEGMPRNAEGYVVNGDGERVDVAYMLKRPLVRLKYLAKTLRGINFLQPSERVEKMTNIFQDLVIAARKRSNDEQARLEDEGAASIDSTRSRDPRSLAPLAGVIVEPSRCVRARDYFDLHLYHSSGQEVSCRVEILLRDDPPGMGKGGDILICEVDSTGRWLLLPPIQQSWVSARNGDLRGEIVVMIRGNQTDGSEWREVMSLMSDDEQAGFEWVHMLGLNPLPPTIPELRKNLGLPSRAEPSASNLTPSTLLSASTESTMLQKSRTPSPHEIEIPIGEQHTEVSKVWRHDTPERRSKTRVMSPSTPIKIENPYLKSSDGRDISQTEGRAYDESSLSQDPDRTPRSLNEAMRMAGTGSPTGLKRTKAKRQSRNIESSPGRAARQITLDDPAEAIQEPHPVEQDEKVQLRRKSTKRRPKSTSSLSNVSQSKGFSVWIPSSDVGFSGDSDSDEREAKNESVSPPDSPPTSPQRPQGHRRVSSVPSMELPVIPRSRKTSQPTTPTKDISEDREEISKMSASAPPKLQKKARKQIEERTMESQEDDQPPPVPPHRSPSPATPVTLKGSNTPVFTPSLLKVKRRSSSPLKHEYEPSTCTESSSESEEEVGSEEEVDEEDEESLTSESSEDELEDDVPMPLMPIGYLGPRGYTSRPYSSGTEKRVVQAEKPEEETKTFPKVSPPSSIYTLPNGTITPSQSASNTPYRAVPHGSGKAVKAVASIFAWSDAGRWDSLHPDECSIVVTPGKIEVFEISAMHSKPFMADGDEIIQPEGRAPLVAVELTPLVPLRKSTAIDISIRSPPTADSQIKTGNNIMLRSRNATECAQLYAMINQSRINNPTYIALQNARGPYGHTSWAEAMDRQNAARTNAGSSSGWLGGTLGRRSSYRKTSTRAASISAATESSVGTMNTALRSALGRFSFGKNGVFSIRNSTLGSRSTGSSFDSGGSGSGTSSPNALGETNRAPGAPAGITNTKCRLYERESLKKWRDMGSARLTIMLASPRPSASNSPPSSSPGQNPLQRAPGTRNISQERRILVTAKSSGKTLLDVTLSETCFERVARSGIAVSVWEDLLDEHGEVGRVAKTGGVSGARARVFMIQMKSEREAAYCFGLLGRLRY